MKQNTFENTNFVVTEEFHASRLDVFVFQLCDFLPSRSYAAKLIKTRAIFVNDKVRKPSFALKTNDVVTVNLSSLQDAQNEIPKAEAIPLDIIYEDAHIIVLNKPAGLVVHPGAGVFSGTLVNALLSHCGSLVPSLGNPSRAGIVHRLDRDTSGVMVAAKTQLALSVLSQQFSEHSHNRIYHAVCYGAFEKKSGYLETGHARDPSNRIKYKVFPLGEGKRAAMNYKVQETVIPATRREALYGEVTSRGIQESFFSLVECTLETGRTHQIRVQMAYLKHAVVGDILYSQVPGRIQNNPKAFSIIKEFAKRQLLHAVTLEITHPETKQRMKFAAPYPKDFEDFMTHANAYFT